MQSVRFGKIWDINSREDYDKAMSSLDDSEFIAEMSDSYSVTCNEKQEIEKQRIEVIRQAKEKNILKGA